jgi:hypothetical protein
VGSCRERPANVQQVIHAIVAEYAKLDPKHAGTSIGLWLGQPSGW